MVLRVEGHRRPVATSRYDHANLLEETLTLLVRARYPSLHLTKVNDVVDVSPLAMAQEKPSQGSFPRAQHCTNIYKYS